MNYTRSYLTNGFEVECTRKCHADPAAFAEGISQRDRIANFVIGGRMPKASVAPEVYGTAELC
jgi:hypothetical protein